MWCSECRFSGVRGDHGCGVVDANVTMFQSGSAMWGREESLNGGQRCGVVNADLAVSVVIMDVG